MHVDLVSWALPNSKSFPWNFPFENEICLKYWVPYQVDFFAGLSHKQLSGQAKVAELWYQQQWRKNQKKLKRQWQALRQ